MLALRTVPAAIVLVFASVTSAELRTWTGGHNGLSRTTTARCKGLRLPEAYEGVVVLSSDTTLGELVLPITGGVTLQDGARLLFDERSTKCTEIRINQPYVNHPENWDTLPNRAVPYLDRMPCQWDDVLVPSTGLLNIASLPLTVKSVTLFDENLASNDPSLELLSIHVAPDSTCTKNTCPCQEEHPLDAEQCEFISREVLRQSQRFNLRRDATIFQDEPFCRQPIRTPRSCQKICGAVIISNDLELVQKIEQLLRDGKQDGVDYYKGLFFDVDKKTNFRQVIIVDRDAGSGGRHTLKVVQELEKELAKEAHHFYNITTSGEPIIPATFANSATGMLLMTFALTTLAFVGMFLVFVSPIRQLDVRNFRANAANFRPFLFARFDNDGEEDAHRVDIAFSSVEMSASSSQADNANVVPLETTENGEECEGVGATTRDWQQARRPHASSDPRVETFKILEDNVQQINRLENATH